MKMDDIGFITKYDVINVYRVQNTPSDAEFIGTLKDGEFRPDHTKTSDFGLELDEMKKIVKKMQEME